MTAPPSLFQSGVARGQIEAKREKTAYIIQKVAQALSILEQFRDDVDELSLTELSKRLSLNERCIGQLVLTLKSRNYIELDPATDKFRLGFKNLELAQTLLRHTDLYRISQPALARIFDACSENTAVAVLRKWHAIELDAIQSELPVQVVSRVGLHLPVHCTAAGKVLIASLPSGEREVLLAGLELRRHTHATIGNAAELSLALGRVLRQGYATEEGEFDREVCSVAAVIRDYAGHPVGAIAVTGPSCRISAQRLAGELATLVREGAAEISAKLGFCGCRTGAAR